jgi:hypothetical protein
LLAGKLFFGVFWRSGGVVVVLVEVVLVMICWWWGWWVAAWVWLASLLALGRI